MKIIKHLKDFFKEEESVKDPITFGGDWEGNNIVIYDPEKVMLEQYHTEKNGTEKVVLIKKTGEKK